MVRRHTYALAALTALVTGGIVLGAGLAAEEGAREPGSPARERRSDEGASLEIRGFRSELRDRETVVPGGRVSWSTRWRLCWAPVRGARGYVVTAVTSEGRGTRPRAVAEPCYALTVASGLASRRGERPGRDEQLALMRATLAVSVAARLPDGELGPPSVDIPVGAEHPEDADG